MGLVGAAEVGADTVGQHSGREEAIGLGDAALGVDPTWFDGVQPGALDRQGAQEQSDALAGPFCLSVVVVGPRAHLCTDVPGGIIPDQQQCRLVFLGQSLQTPAKELRRDRTELVSMEPADDGKPCDRCGWSPLVIRVIEEVVRREDLEGRS